MDNGQSVNNAGLTGFDAEKNAAFDQNNWQVSADVDSRAIGNKAMDMLSENSAENKESAQVVDMQMPPGVEPINEEILKPQDELKTGVDFEAKNLKTTDLLDREGVSEVDAAINKLNQDGNIADFYETARKMNEVNLDNSYGEQSAWKKVA